MTRKADFNAEEWSTVVEAPLLAGLEVVGAARGGTIRETMAIGKVYTHAREAHGENELLDEIVATPPALDPQRVQASNGLKGVSSEPLHEALALLDGKGQPEDVAAYKKFVLEVARAAAEAHKEGGFIGIGGRKISDEEQAALDEIASALESDRSSADG